MTGLKKFFGDGAFWKGTLRLALPISLQNLLISSFAFSRLDALIDAELSSIMTVL